MYDLVYGRALVQSQRSKIKNLQTFMPEIVASKASVSATTPWTSQTYLLPRRASVMWPSR